MYSMWRPETELAVSQDLTTSPVTVALLGTQHLQLHCKSHLTCPPFYSRFYLWHRIIESARVINDEICYDIKYANLLYEVCHCRYRLHKLVYSHTTGDCYDVSVVSRNDLDAYLARAIEYMIVDALLAAEKKLKIAEQIRDPERYVYLTDDIMPQIEKERGDKVRLLVTLLQMLCWPTYF